jgi:hypothetical protein
MMDTTKKSILLSCFLFCATSLSADNSDLDFQMGGFGSGGADNIAFGMSASEIAQASSATSCSCSGSIDSGAEKIKKAVIEDFAKPNYQTIVSLIEEINESTRVLRNRTRVVEDSSLADFADSAFSKLTNKPNSSMKKEDILALLSAIKKKKSYELAELRFHIKKEVEK